MYDAYSGTPLLGAVLADRTSQMKRHMGAATRRFNNVDYHYNRYTQERMKQALKAAVLESRKPLDDNGDMLQYNTFSISS